ncbi:MAG: hypothetical protein WKF57_11310 [Nakamurella sp.]
MYSTTTGAGTWSQVENDRIVMSGFDRAVGTPADPSATRSQGITVAGVATAFEPDTDPGEAEVARSETVGDAGTSAAVGAVDAQPDTSNALTSTANPDIAARLIP